LAGLVSGAVVDGGDDEGEGEGVCACVPVAKHDQKTREATSELKAMVFTRFIVSPLKVFPPNVGHHPPRIQTKQARRLADESRAVRGGCMPLLGGGANGFIAIGVSSTFL
jgi:hypothetical protein